MTQRPGRLPSSGSRWSDARIIQAKKTIKEELDRYLDQGHRRARLVQALQRIHETIDDMSSSGRLHCYIYIMSALVHHERWGGLKPSQVTRLVNHAYNILKLQEITSTSERLGFLYGELHLVLSQIYRNDGRVWESTWQHHLYRRAIKSDPSHSEGFKALGLGLRALRLGQVEYALSCYETAELNAASRRDFSKARLGRLKALRFKGKIETARQLLTRTVSEGPFDEDIVGELDWERICLDGQVSGDLSAMVESVRKSGRHYEAAYVLEAFLWVYALRTRNYINMLPKLSTYKRDKTLRVSRQGFLYDCVSSLVMAYDTGFPIDVRLKRLGSALAQRHLLIGLDHELLFMAAAGRWLVRIHNFELAKFVLNDYRDRFFSISQGQNDDVFGLITDVLSKSWFRGDPDHSKGESID